MITFATEEAPTSGAHPVSPFAREERLPVLSSLRERASSGVIFRSAKERPSFRHPWNLR